MEKQKLICRFLPYEGKVIAAKREIPYEIKLSSRLILDELCFQYNKKTLEKAINVAIDTGRSDAFQELSKSYSHYIWE